VIAGAIMVPWTLARAPRGLFYFAPGVVHFSLLTLATAAARGDPYQEPRYLVLYLWFGVPFIAAGLSHLLQASRKVLALAAACALLLIVGVGLVQSFAYQNAFAWDVKETGIVLGHWLRRSRPPKKILMEREGFAETLAIPVTSGYPDRFVSVTRDELISAIKGGAEFRTPEIGVWVLKDPVTVQTAAASVRVVRVIGDYFIGVPGDLPVPESLLGGDALQEPGPGLEAWSPLDRDQHTYRLPARTLVFEFDSDDILPGQRVGVIRSFEVLPGTCYRIEALIKDEYGIRRFPGRFQQQVVVDGRVVWSHDISGDGTKGWQVMRAEVMAIEPRMTVEVRLLAVGEVEKGWGWERVSRTSVRGLRVRPC
jgi:hypothetical protein